MKIYITGLDGFIATHLAAELRANGHVVVGADLADGVDYCEPGMALAELALHAPDLLIHNAAQVGRLFGEDDVRHTIESNALMTTRVAQACAETDTRMLYLSTSEVYGDQGLLEVSEGDQCVLPHNLYGLTKRWGEEVAQLYAPKLQIIRLSMPYGPGLPAGRGRAALVNFLYNALHNQTLTVHKNSERAWCWVGDTVRGIRVVIEKGGYCNGKRGSGIYNVGRDDNKLPMEAVARLACDLTGASYDLIQMIDPPANQTTVKRLSNYKLRQLGWKPEVELEEGMRRTLTAVRDM